jgi:tetratricopeptide (TPR) repeat protein
LWCFTSFLVVAATAFADPDPAEKRFRDEIAAVNPAAATAWDAANAARDGGHVAEAADGYRKVIALAPAIDHPHRRLCAMLAAQDQLDAAVDECNQAMSLAPDSPYDASTFASVMIARNKPGDLQRGLQFSSIAAQQLPDDPTIAEVHCEAYAATQNIRALRPCIDHLLAIAPKSATGNLHAAQLALADHDAAHASTYLERAKAAGLDNETYARLRSRVDYLQPPAAGKFDTKRAIAIGAVAVALIAGIWIFWLLKRRR